MRVEIDPAHEAQFAGSRVKPRQLKKSRREAPPTANMEQAPPAQPLEAPSVEAVAAAARQQALDATLEKPLDFEPPAACVMRIVKSAIPDNIQVTKEAKQAFAKAAGIFIVYLTTCANDICKDKKKQTVTAQDILAACGELELDDVKPQLEEFLAALRAHESGKRKAASAPVEEPAAQRPAVEPAPPADDEDSDDAPLESLVTVTAAQ